MIVRHLSLGWWFEETPTFLAQLLTFYILQEERRKKKEEIYEGAHPGNFVQQKIWSCYFCLVAPVLLLGFAIYDMGLSTSRFMPRIHIEYKSCVGTRSRPSIRYHDR